MLLLAFILFQEFGPAEIKYMFFVAFSSSYFILLQTCERAESHTHTRLTALFQGLPGRAGTREVKPIWVLLKQLTVSGSSISWAICNSAPRSRQITMPAPHRSVFLQAGCPSCRPTNSVKALNVRACVRVCVCVCVSCVY